MSATNPVVDAESASHAAHQIDRNPIEANIVRYLLRCFGYSPSCVFTEADSPARGSCSIRTVQTACDELGLVTYRADWQFDRIKREMLPCVVMIDEEYPVVLVRVGSFCRVYDPVTASIERVDSAILGQRIQSSTNSGDGSILFVRPGIDFRRGGIPPQRPDYGDTLRRLIRFGRLLIPYRRLLVQSFLIHLALASLGILAAICTQTVIDLAVGQSTLSVIWILGASLVVIQLSTLLAKFSQRWIVFFLGSRIHTSVSSLFVRRLTNSDVVQLAQLDTGQVLERIRDTVRIRELFVEGTILTLHSALTFFLFSMILVAYSPLVYVVFILGSVLAAAVAASLSTHRRSLDNKVFAARAEKTQVVAQVSRGMLEVRALGLQEELCRKWEQRHARCERLQMRSIRLDQLDAGSTTILTEVKNVTILCVCASSVASGTMTVGMLFAVAFIAGQLNQPIVKLVDLIRSLQQALLSLVRIEQVIQLPGECGRNFLGIDGQPECPVRRCTLWMEEITFTFAPGRSQPALKNVSCRFEPDTLTAIVGPSGGGKSTILGVLLGLYGAEEGTFGVGDTSTTEWGLRHWRSLFGVCLQEATLFDGSLADNITGFAPHPNEDLLQRAIRIACLDTDIRSGQLDLRGSHSFSSSTSLSAGQRQRVGIARAVYRQPPIILLDEATSAVDYQCERTIIENLKNETDGRVIFVTHRIGAVRRADSILVLDRGEIVSSGTHEHLMTQCPSYRNMVTRSEQVYA